MRTKVLSILLSAILLLPLSLNAADRQDISTIEKNLKEMIQINNIGTDFWFSIPPCYEETAGNNFLRIYITSPYQAQVIISVPGKDFSRSVTTIPNDVIAVDIPPAIAQPLSKDKQAEAIPERIYQDYGINITSTGPIAAYAAVRFQATSDGFMCVPSSGLGMEYIISAYAVDPMFKDIWNMHLPSITCITAVEDNTTISFLMGGTEYSETAGGLAPGDLIDTVLNEGDVWMFMSRGDGSDLSGSKVVADKPISVVSGNQCTNIPIGNQWCDYTVEMQLPTSTWGTEYLVPYVPGRKYPGIARIYASEANTAVYLDGVQVGFLTESGGIIDEAYIEIRLGPIEENQNKPRVISADKPIGVTFYNPGVQEDGYPLPNSDPFTMLIKPMELFQDEIVFCIPGTMGGAYFMDNYINLVYESDEDGTVPNDLQFMEVSDTNPEWQNINTLYPGNGDVFPEMINDKYYAQKLLELPQTGSFRIRAAEPFAAYSFGYDWCDSYGYPTSSALNDWNTEDNESPMVQYNFAEYGDIPDGIADDGENGSKLAKVLFFSDSSYNYEFTCEKFIPGVSRKTGWELNLIDHDKNGRALFAFTDKAGNDTIVNLYFFNQPLEVNPETIDFGEVEIGLEADKWIDITNISFDPVIINSVSLETTESEFQITSGIENFSLGSDQKINVNIKFSPSIAGIFTNRLIVTYNDGKQEAIDITARAPNPNDVEPGHSYSLSEVNPNPVMNSGAKIDYSVGAYGQTELKLYDSEGRFITTLVSRAMTAGNYSVRLPIEKLSSGVFICRMISGPYEKSITIRVVK